MLAVIGKKVGQTQKFLEDGTRIPVTVVATPGNTVTQVKMADKEGYFAVQLAYGERKIANKPSLGHAKKAQLTKAPLFMAEARFSEKESQKLPTLGDLISTETVLTAGDIVDVSGKSKGKGFAGGVKRYHFKGGPKTHGQSDRHRAPGSIGSTTTPGRVYKGKRMAGKMGNDMTTLKNLEIVEVGKDFVWVKGVVPGVVGAVVIIKPTGKKNKKFVGVLREKSTEEVVNAPVVEEVSPEELKVEIPAEEVKTKETAPIEEKVEEEVKADTKESSQPEVKEEVK